MVKKAQYKTFAFPNKLTELETYYYYLLEFDVIPKKISGDKIAEVFTHVAQDYLKGLLNTSKFATISFHLMTYIEKGEHDPTLSRLLDYCYELDDSHPKEIAHAKQLLTMYVRNPDELME